MIKIKTFQSTTRYDLEQDVNLFLEDNSEKIEVKDIKLHVDPMADPNWRVQETYCVMVIYATKGDV